MGYDVVSSTFGQASPTQQGVNIFILENASPRQAEVILNFQKMHYGQKKSRNVAIILIREVNNHIASILEYKKRTPGFKGENIINLGDFSELYREYANEFLSITNYLEQFDLTVKVAFDKWFKSVEYRKRISKQLNVAFEDSGLNFVSRAGGGSSFDGRLFDGRAQEMRVCERGVFLKNNTKLLKPFITETARQSSEAIFGSVLPVRVYNSSHGTFPLVLHNPMNCRNGKDNFTKLWRQARETLNNEKHIAPLAVEQRVTIITWNNSPIKGSLERSLDRLGWSYSVLGQEIGDWRNKVKLVLTTHELEKIKTPYVMGVDSIDGLILDSPQTILERFEREFECSLLFNASPCSWPPIHKLTQFDKRVNLQSHYKYLNAGGWIGKTEYCRYFFRRCLDWSFPDSGNIAIDNSEQKYVKAVFMESGGAVEVDYRCIIFQIFHPAYEQDPSVRII